MGWENWLDLATVFISVVALGFAWFSWRMSHHTDRRMVEIEESRDAEARRQGAKASLVAGLEVSTSTGGMIPRITGRQLVIANEGPGAARFVRARIDDVEVTSMTAAPLDARGGVERLDPGAVVKISFGYAEMVNMTFKRVRVEWEDGSGEPGSFESEL